MSIVDELIDLRKSAGLTKSEMGIELGYSETYVQRIERGELNVVEETIYRYAGYFNLPNEEFERLIGLVSGKSKQNVLVNELIKLRVSAKLNRQEMGEALGRSVNFISAMERGVYPVTRKTIRLYVDYFDLSDEEAEHLEELKDEQLKKVVAKEYASKKPKRKKLNYTLIHAIDKKYNPNGGWSWSTVRKNEPLLEQLRKEMSVME